MSVTNTFANVTTATGAQLDQNFADCLQLNAANKLTNSLNYATSVTLASAASVAIGAAASNNITISGTTTITSFDTIAEGAIRHVTYSGAVPITYNVTSMQLVGGVSRTNAVGDVSIFRSLGSGNWVEEFYQPASGILVSAAQDFRLTLTTATPVTTADVAGATTVYCTPYKGRVIALWNGAAWQNYTSNEFSIALGTLTSGKPYDVFCYQNAGVPTLELGTAWTNDTTRAVALAYQNGILVKSGDATRRYLGTFYTTATTTTEDSVANRYLYNYYNKASRQMKRRETTASWVYTTATIRQANGSTANQLNFIVGVSEDVVRADLIVAVNNTNAAVYIAAGIGLDSTTTPAADAIMTGVTTSGAGYGMTMPASYSGVPSAGRHFLTWLEYSAATGTTTWTGIPNTAALIIPGINGSLMA